ncbi:hypothetical protein [Rahnella inusitata]|uniref:hypothetical protein n=1 Tax=Rahnella inusitata TaxID=58169 RepID=UPI0039BE0E85
MNYFTTVKALSERMKFAQRDWFYDFRELGEQISESECLKVANSQAEAYSKITKHWDSERNSEWICRHYLSAKMIMSATLNINTMLYAHAKNIRLTTPYLTYYALLSLLRGIVYTLPSIGWDNGKMITLTHSKIIQFSFEFIGKFNKDVAKNLKDTVIKAKANRELISYKSPTSGDRIIDNDSDIITIATLFSELIQFNSEIMEASIAKNSQNKSVDFLHRYIKQINSLNLGGNIHQDKEDSYRLGYLQRKHPSPPNVQHIMTEGHTEDFFGAWYPEDDSDEKDFFNPDKDWQIIFDIP